jgi:hypothetical protein
MIMNRTFLTIGLVAAVAISCSAGNPVDGDAGRAGQSTRLEAGNALGVGALIRDSRDRAIGFLYKNQYNFGGFRTLACQNTKMEGCSLKPILFVALHQVWWKYGVA